MIKIVVVDDDSAICELISVNLELIGCTCTTSTDPIKGLALIKQELPNLVILDVMMPEMDGYTLALKIRQNKDTASIPIIMLTALGELNDKLHGFSSGVDDYLTKPFEIEELKARIRALLLRSANSTNKPQNMAKRVIGDITMLPETYEVKIIDKTAKLTPTEFEILNLLVQNNGEIVSLTQMLKEIWGYNDDQVDIIRVHIKHLRTKIEKISQPDKKYIETVYGGGYKLVAEGFCPSANNVKKC